MSQSVFSDSSPTPDMAKPIMNVGEAWQIYDTILIGGLYNVFKPNQGYFLNYVALGNVPEVSFFNVRNRSYGIPYNNQDTRDQLPYVMHIYQIGASFIGPSTSCYEDYTPAILTEYCLQNAFFTSELPKHCSLSFRTNQDERLLSNVTLVPPGYGPVGGGLATGDLQSVHNNPNVGHHSTTMGESILTNTWGFHKPLAIPRTANISVTIRFSVYAQTMLQRMFGPGFQPMRDNAHDGTYYGAYATSMIQVFLRGKREVQQRGQYHA